MGLSAADTELEVWLKEKEDAMVADIASLVEIPSISGEREGSAPYGRACRDVLQKMLEIGRRYGFACRSFQDKCVVIRYGEGRKSIGIWGHLDVVPEGEGWLYPPFACTRKGDILIGRGVQDNKGPAAALLYAMRYLKEKGMVPGVTFLQILGCREEVDMEDVSSYLEENQAPDVSFVTDCAFPVCYGEKGICRVELISEVLDGNMLLLGGNAVNSIPAYACAKIRLREEGTMEIQAEGVSGHAAFPQGAKNALGILAERILGRHQEENILSDKEERVLLFLKKACGGGFGRELNIDCEDEISGALTASGTVVRMEEQRVVLEMDIRYPVTLEADSILERLEREAAQYGFSIESCEDNRPSYMDKDSPFVICLSEAYEEVRKDGKKPYVMGGGTYARKIPNAVGFGPGLEFDCKEAGLPRGHGNCHGADEAQSVSSLKTAVRIYVKALQKLNELYENNAGSQ